MKKLLSKVFFVSDCAKGATFALTLLFLGNYFWFSLFHLLSLWCGISWRLTEIFSILMALTAIYSLALGVIALIGLVKVLRRECRFKALWHLVPAGVCFTLGAVGFVRVFPPVYFMAAIGEKVSKPSRLPCWLESGGFPRLPSEYWAAVFFLSLLLILAGGLFLTATFAAAEGKKFRSAFGRATLAVWGVFALWYISTLGLAYRESRACSAARQAVEKRFGHPLTAAGLEKLYRESGKVDADFWPRQEKLRAALPKVKMEKKDEDGEEWSQEYEFWEIMLPDRPSEATLAWYGNYCRTNRAALEKYENCFDREPPLPEKRFLRGNLAAEALPTLSPCRSFVRDFERSRLVYYLAVGDADAAWVCYRRMGNVGAYLQKEIFLIGSLVWLNVEQRRLDCVEKLLESRQLSDAKLNELDADLAALERDIPRNHQQAMYTEAVFGQDAIAGLEDGLLDPSAYEPLNPPGAFAPYRWIFPDWWYHTAMDKKTMLQTYLLPDFTHFDPAPVNPGLIMCNMMLPSFETAGARFYALTARVRGMRVLIRAEKYRRKHDEFPKTLADLPLDPFTGKLLVYTVGKAEINEAVWKKTMDEATTIRRTADVVQVHSEPETTARLKVSRPKDFEDPTRAMIRY